MAAPETLFPNKVRSRGPEARARMCVLFGGHNPSLNRFRAAVSEASKATDCSEKLPTVIPHSRTTALQERQEPPE